MILIQYIKGASMYGLDPAHFSRSVRKQILRSIVQLWSQAYEKSVVLADLAPRNVLVIALNGKQPQTVCIDFGDAIIDHDAKPPTPLGPYVSPFSSWNFHFIYEFSTWTSN
jgi:RIO-like serine/threonine protein kinase